MTTITYGVSSCLYDKSKLQFPIKVDAENLGSTVAKQTTEDALDEAINNNTYFYYDEFHTSMRLFPSAKTSYFTEDGSYIPSSDTYKFIYVPFNSNNETEGDMFSSSRKGIKNGFKRLSYSFKGRNECLCDGEDDWSARNNRPFRLAGGNNAGYNHEKDYSSKSGDVDDRYIGAKGYKDDIVIFGSSPFSLSETNYFVSTDTASSSCWANDQISFNELNRYCEKLLTTLWDEGKVSYIRFTRDPIYVDWGNVPRLRNETLTFLTNGEFKTVKIGGVTFRNDEILIEHKQKVELDDNSEKKRYDITVYPKESFWMNLGTAEDDINKLEMDTSFKNATSIFDDLKSDNSTVLIKFNLASYSSTVKQALTSSTNAKGNIVSNTHYSFNPSKTFSFNSFISPNRSLTEEIKDLALYTNQFPDYYTLIRSNATSSYTVFNFFKNFIESKEKLSSDWNSIKSNSDCVIVNLPSITSTQVYNYKAYLLLKFNEVCHYLLSGNYTKAKQKLKEMFTPSKKIISYTSFDSCDSPICTQGINDRDVMTPFTESIATLFLPSMFDVLMSKTTETFRMERYSCNDLSLHPNVERYSCNDKPVLRFYWPLELYYYSTSSYKDTQKCKEYEPYVEDNPSLIDSYKTARSNSDCYRRTFDFSTPALQLFLEGYEKIDSYNEIFQSTINYQSNNITSGTTLEVAFSNFNSSKCLDYKLHDDIYYYRLLYNKIKYTKGITLTDLEQKIIYYNWKLGTYGVEVHGFFNLFSEIINQYGNNNVSSCNGCGFFNYLKTGSTTFHKVGNTKPYEFGYYNTTDKIIELLDMLNKYWFILPFLMFYTKNWKYNTYDYAKATYANLAHDWIFTAADLSVGFKFPEITASDNYGLTKTATIDFKANDSIYSIHKTLTYEMSEPIVYSSSKAEELKDMIEANLDATTISNYSDWLIYYREKYYQNQAEHYNDIYWWPRIKDDAIVLLQDFKDIYLSIVNNTATASLIKCAAKDLVEYLIWLVEQNENFKVENDSLKIKTSYNSNECGISKSDKITYKNTNYTPDTIQYYPAAKLDTEDKKSVGNYITQQDVINYFKTTKSKDQSKWTKFITVIDKYEKITNGGGYIPTSNSMITQLITGTGTNSIYYCGRAAKYLKFYTSAETAKAQALDMITLNEAYRLKIAATVSPNPLISKHGIPTLNNLEPIVEEYVSGIRYCDYSNVEKYIQQAELISYNGTTELAKRSECGSISDISGTWNIPFSAEINLASTESSPVHTAAYSTAIENTQDTYICCCHYNVVPSNSKQDLCEKKKYSITNVAMCNCIYRWKEINWSSIELAITNKLKNDYTATEKSVSLIVEDVSFNDHLKDYVVSYNERFTSKDMEIHMAHQQNINSGKCYAQQRNGVEGGMQYSKDCIALPLIGSQYSALDTSYPDHKSVDVYLPADYTTAVSTVEYMLQQLGCSYINDETTTTISGEVKTKITFPSAQDVSEGYCPYVLQKNCIFLSNDVTALWMDFVTNENSLEYMLYEIVSLLNADNKSYIYKRLFDEFLPLAETITSNTTIYNLPIGVAAIRNNANTLTPYRLYGTEYTAVKVNGDIGFSMKTENNYLNKVFSDLLKNVINNSDNPIFVINIPRSKKELLSIIYEEMVVNELVYNATEIEAVTAIQNGYVIVISSIQLSNLNTLRSMYIPKLKIEVDVSDSKKRIFNLDKTLFYIYSSSDVRCEIKGSYIEIEYDDDFEYENILEPK